MLASSTACWTSAMIALVGAGGGEGHAVEPVVAGPAGVHLLVEGDQRGDERLAVADDDALADEGVGAQAVLEHRGGDVLAAGGHEDLLLAPGDPQEAVVVELADVAGVEPAVADRLGGRRVVAAVAAEQVDAAQADLAVVGDAHVDAGQRQADRADPHLAGAVDGGRGGGLGEAVALEDRDADAAVEVAEAGAERGAAGDGVLHLAAHRLAQLAVDQLVEHGVAQPQAERHAARHPAPPTRRWRPRRHRRRSCPCRRPRPWPRPSCRSSRRPAAPRG